MTAQASIAPQRTATPYLYLEGFRQPAPDGRMAVRATWSEPLLASVPWPLSPSPADQMTSFMARIASVADGVEGIDEILKITRYSAMYALAPGLYYVNVTVNLVRALSEACGLENLQIRRRGPRSGRPRRNFEEIRIVDPSNIQLIFA